MHGLAADAGQTVDRIINLHRFTRYGGLRHDAIRRTLSVPYTGFVRSIKFSCRLASNLVARARIGGLHNADIRIEPMIMIIIMGSALA